MTNEIKLPLTSADVTEALLLQLREASPQIFSEGKVDFSKLQAALGEHISTDPERYGLTWAGKRDAFRNVQVPSVATLRPQPTDSVNWDSTENLIIEGDNLEVLKLLQKPYHGKIKMIYIDPPYNTGNEFIYPDNFREGLDEYLRYTQQLSEEGTATSTNKETSGRYHSNWLNMMYPRLFLARNLLREDGVIFVSIDDHEVHNLRMLMDEVFGEENFLASICWQKTYSPANDKKGIDAMHDYVLCYGRSETVKVNLLPRTEKQDSAYLNPDNDPRGPWKAVDATRAEHRDYAYYAIITPSGKEVLPSKGRSWVFTKEELPNLLAENRLWFGKDGSSKPSKKLFLTKVKQGIVPTTWWPHDECGHNDESKKELKRLFPEDLPFSTPKPARLIKRMLRLSTTPGEKPDATPHVSNMTATYHVGKQAKTVHDETDIVLDFFAGSGTTAHAVLELNQEDGGNRKFILVQLPEKTENPQYPTIANITRERVRRVIAKLKNDNEGQLALENDVKPDLGFRAFKLDSSNFKIWRSNNAAQSAEQMAEQLNLYADNIQPERSDQDRLYELIMKSGRCLSARVERMDIGQRTAFAVGGGDLMICLEQHLDRDTLRALFARKPQIVLCLDTAFDGNDALKTNTVLEAQSHGIIFKTV